MSSTNKTLNLELSQFIGSDKPTWLSDYNGDMSKIDTGFGQVKSQADAADLNISGLQSSVSGISSTVSDQSTAITNLQTAVSGNTGSINTINSLIGNGEPTTTDKTLIGAINEINAEVSPTVKTETLLANGTSVTFTGMPTTGTHLIDFYISDASDYTSIDISVAGQVTLTYEAAIADRTVTCVIKGV